MGAHASGVALRAVVADDLPAFFEMQRDPIAAHMAAFTAADPTDRAAFQAQWDRILASEANTNRTILYDGQVAGHIFSYPFEGQQEVGYWLSRAYWGRGIATAALTLFLRDLPTRPLHARAAADNHASIHVLRACGFTLIGRATSFANARGAEIEEDIFLLDAVAERSIAALRQHCLAFPQTNERLSHGEPTWFIRDKRAFVTFANRHHDERVAFWCAASPLAQRARVASDPQRFFIPPYVGTRGWLGVWLDTPPPDWDDLSDLITDAYRLVAPKRLLAEYDAHPPR